MGKKEEQKKWEPSQFQLGALLGDVEHLSKSLNVSRKDVTLRMITQTNRAKDAFCEKAKRHQWRNILWNYRIQPIRTYMRSLRSFGIEPSPLTKAAAEEANTDGIRTPSKRRTDIAADADDEEDDDEDDDDDEDEDDEDEDDEDEDDYSQQQPTQRQRVPRTNPSSAEQDDKKRQRVLRSENPTSRAPTVQNFPPTDTPHTQRQGQPTPPVGALRRDSGATEDFSSRERTPIPMFASKLHPFQGTPGTSHNTYLSSSPLIYSSTMASSGNNDQARCT